MKKSSAMDFVIAGAVILCSVILFYALSAAIGGKALGAGGKEVRVLYADVTGIKIGSQVKYAGAPAGRVTAIRILTEAESRELDRPGKHIELTLALRPGTPPLRSDASATIEADTLLSDKFVALHPGHPEATPLAAGSALEGTAPVTFDAITRDLGGLLRTLEAVIGELGDETKGLIPELRGLIPELTQLVRDASTLLADTRPVVGEAEKLVAETRSLIGEGETLVGEARGFVGDGNRLITENEDAIQQLLARLTSASIQLERAASSAEGIVTDNEDELEAALSDLQLSMKQLRVLTTYLNFLSHRLATKPSDLIWGGRNRNLPQPSDILQSPEAVFPEPR